MKVFLINNLFICTVNHARLGVHVQKSLTSFCVKSFVTVNLCPKDKYFRYFKSSLQRICIRLKEQSKITNKNAHTRQVRLYRYSIYQTTVKTALQSSVTWMLTLQRDWILLDQSKKLQCMLQLSFFQFVLLRLRENQTSYLTDH